MRNLRLLSVICVMAMMLIPSGSLADWDYPLSPLVIRFYLPSYAACRDDFTPRFRALTELLDRYAVDAFVNSMWQYPETFWDLLCVKLHPSHPAYFYHVHSFPAAQWKSRSFNVEEMFDCYAAADGVVCLSETDRAYWSAVNPNACYIPNPCFVSAAARNASL